MSEELKHTPGPWAAFQSKPDVGTNYWRIRTASPESGLLDTIGGYCGEANARLIEAAPDLLEALRNIVSVACEYYDMDMGDNGSAALEAAYAAIAKAGGGEP